jgi:hypothetical protein
METIIFITSFFGNGKRSVPKVATEAKPRDVNGNIFFSASGKKTEDCAS